MKVVEAEEQKTLVLGGVPSKEVMSLTMEI